MVLTDAKRWFVATGRRSTVAAVLLGGLLAFFVLLQVLGVVSVAKTQATLTVLGYLLVGNITLITIVVSVDQLVLSRELKTPSQAHSQIESVTEYRQNVANATDIDVPPVEPFRFLRVLLFSIRHRVRSLEDEMGADRDSALRADVSDLSSRLDQQMNEVERALDRADRHPFIVFYLLLARSYPQSIHHIRKLQAEHQLQLSENENDRLNRIVDQLEQVGIAQQYFQSLYMEEELSYLSRTLLYVGLATEISLVALIFAFNSSQYPPIFGALLPVGLTVGLAPLIVLFTFILRVATVSHRTTSSVIFSRPPFRE